MSENAASKPNAAIIGAGPKRIDGRLKVTGSAPYASDHQPENMVYGHGVFSTIASGKIRNIDLGEAKASPGVIDIFHHGHFPELYHTPSSMAQQNKVEETRLPFEDDTVYYAGQFVALVVADTFENARAAAYKVKVDYEEHDAIANLDQAVKAHGTQPTGSQNNHQRGDADAAFGNAAHTIDVTYHTSVETHNPMEMHATVAEWRDDQLKVYEASQAVLQERGALAKIFGIAPNQVEVISPFIGSGFGSKLWMWPHAVTAAAAAKMLDRPVQVVVPRNQMFTTTGHRPETRQRLRLGTDDNGKLVSISHDSINTTSFTDQYVETCGAMTKALYGCEDVTVTHETTQVNRGTPTSMRAPGATPGLFALESAIDEMAVAAGIDPLEFRMNNYSERDQSKDLPWSSNKIREATQQAAESFGWSKRSPEIGSMRDGNEIIGWGMAACNWEALRRACDARVSLRADGTAYVTCATQDIGTGTYTVVAQAVSSVTGLPVEKITVKLGDTAYPEGPISGGSWATATTLPAVAKATRLAIDQLMDHATGKKSPLEGAKAEDLSFANGKLHHSDGRSVDFTEVLASQRLASADGEGHTGGADTDSYSFRSFGAHFVEIRWDPGISNLRVSRVVSAIDVGQVINSKTSRNQVEGSLVMGIGSALFEGTEYDARNGIPVNNNYAEYLVPTHADQPPEMEVILLDYPDYAFNEFGARGIGEIGITGVSAAIANAIYHATGKRIRELPIRKEKLMENVPSATA
ncbi:xanthine dehydrogenase family protein molybdopterin-binding subunit [Marinobacter nanhaiticus D15-8W]|uniref:Xanthine dehydrogenase family protein molybdopterin-binding subunit n=1 Tax=Marinobacter nanhaiticus D15-8W TaxID=626887 RepID=N6W4W2_9GAMM|nr:xanthine dehydrogenase family protein molybdopterin-binding subunit [Marinobacter nanhaiticus]ENO15194.1 xanthine dehydrogenase family protein molybdopterin-binding subunit [Marinobacter nanhaiticus D15-8W]BES69104.1 xanthine dehydrogenase family protein molybdopterin-binding subunit [Marinobacter nanhaiticus D15-8W]